MKVTQINSFVLLGEAKFNVLQKQILLNSKGKNQILVEEVIKRMWLQVDSQAGQATGDSSPHCLSLECAFCSPFPERESFAGRNLERAVCC